MNGRFFVVIAVVIVVLLFGWPTPYQQFTYGTGGVTLRVNRLTGATSMLTPNGWIETSGESPISKGDLPRKMEDAYQILGGIALGMILIASGSRSRGKAFSEYQLIAAGWLGGMVVPLLMTLLYSDEGAYRLGEVFGTSLILGAILSGVAARLLKASDAPVEVKSDR